MNREYQDFCAGILIGILILCVILAVLRIVNWKSEYAVYENKLAIKYRNPTQGYDIEYHMTNPKDSNRGGAK